MSRIAIDCDGVLADFTQAFVHECNHLWPGRFPFDFEPTAWDALEGWGLTPTEEGLVWQRIKRTPNWWLTLNAMPGLSDLQRWLISHAGHDIFVCTSRCSSLGATTTMQTHLWLQSCGLRGVNNFVGVITVPKSKHKCDVYQAMEIEWSLDDKPETVIDCGLIDTMEHHAWLLSQPWNAKAGVHNRTSSVQEFLEKIA